MLVGPLAEGFEKRSAGRGCVVLGVDGMMAAVVCCHTEVSRRCRRARRALLPTHR